MIKYALNKVLKNNNKVRKKKQMILYPDDIHPNLPHCFERFQIGHVCKSSHEFAWERTLINSESGRRLWWVSWIVEDIYLY